MTLAKSADHVVQLRTVDGGLHWDTLPQDTGWFLESVLAVDDSVGFLAFSQPNSEGPPQYGVLRTGDAGLTWRRLSLAGDSDIALLPWPKPCGPLPECVTDSTAQQSGG